MPVRAPPHEFWTVDVRELGTPGCAGGRVAVISIPENDGGANLAALCAAIRQHGDPEALVSDKGAAFEAKQARRIREALGVAVLRRDPCRRAAARGRRPRPGPPGSTRAAGRPTQPGRGARSGRQGRGAARGADGGVGPTRFGRLLDRAGYIRSRHRRISGQRGPAKRPATVRLFGEPPTLESCDVPSAQYPVEYQPDRARVRRVGAPRQFEASRRGRGAGAVRRRLCP